jgi:predicted O-methyltransferase YrrM
MVAGAYKEDYDRLISLVEAQRLENIVHIHKLDLRTELDGFFQKNQYMQFKLVFLDAGLYDIVKNCLKHFWPRLVSGGVMIFDNFNHELAPGETRAIKEFLPNLQIRAFPFAAMPTAYVVKP